MTEMEIQERISQINEEYAQLKELINCEPPIFEAIGESGDIKVTIVGYCKDGRKMSAEKVIKHNESLDWISDTFSYPAHIGLHSKDIALNGLECAYFDKFGYLMVEHDLSTEKYTIKPEEKRQEITELLKTKLGKKLKI
jgi:hypothetical protein